MLLRVRLVAVSLAAVAGFVDAVGYLTLRGLFIAHMSGNTVKVGVFTGGGSLAEAAPIAAAIACFVAGVAAGTVAAEVAARRRSRRVASAVLVLQIPLVAAFMLYGRTLHAQHALSSRSPAGLYVLVALGVVSMGMQTAALRQVGGRTISTTYVTGVLTSLTQEATNYLFWLRDGPRRDERRSFLSRVLGLGSRDESRRRVALLAGVWVAYAAGGILGSFLDRRIALWALLLPLVTLVAAVAADLRRPLEL